MTLELTASGLLRPAGERSDESECLSGRRGVADRYYGATHDRGYGASRKRPKTGLYDMANLAFFTPFRKCRFWLFTKVVF